jgi:hypothetical protein
MGSVFGPYSTAGILPSRRNALAGPFPTDFLIFVLSSSCSKKKSSPSQVLKSYICAFYGKKLNRDIFTILG